MYQSQLTKANLFEIDKDITRGASKIRSVLHEFGHAFRLLGNTKIEPGISLLRQIMPSPQCVRIREDSIFFRRFNSLQFVGIIDHRRTREYQKNYE